MTNPGLSHIRRLYDDRARHGPFGVLAPHNQGRKKSRYVAAVFDAAMEPIIREIQNDERVLDLGCGTGLGLRPMLGQTPHVIGVDISTNMLRVCRDYCGDAVLGRLVLFDGTSLPFAPASFHRCIMREVLCHLPDDVARGLLVSLHACMRPKGTFYLIDQACSSAQSMDNGLTRKRTEEEIVALAAHAGFRLQRVAVIRRPRTPWVMLFQLNLLPERLIRPLAKLEVRWRRHRLHHECGSSWQNLLLEFSA